MHAHPHFFGPHNTLPLMIKVQFVRLLHQSVFIFKIQLLFVMLELYGVQYQGW